MSRYVIYGLVDPRTDAIRYIGQSRNGLQRARSHSCPSVSRSDKNRHKYYLIQELKSLGMRFEVRVLGEFDNPDVLSDYERWAIAYGRACGWPLVNIQDGGEGGATMTGKKHKPESIEKMRAAHKGRKFSPEHVAKMREVRLGKKASPETRAKLSFIRKSKPLSIPADALARAWELARKPKPWLAEMNKTKKWTDEMRRKVGEARSRNVSNPPKAIWYEFNGERLTIAEWSRRTGISYAKLRARIRDLGWPLDKALATE